MLPTKHVVEKLKIIQVRTAVQYITFGPTQAWTYWKNFLKNSLYKTSSNHLRCLKHGLNLIPDLMSWEITSSLQHNFTTLAQCLSTSRNTWSVLAAWLVLIF